MKLALIILAIFLLIIIGLLFIPIRFKIVFDKNETAKKTKLLLKYGLIKVDFTDKNKKKSKKEEDKEGEKEEEDTKDKASFEDKKKKIEGYIKLFEITKNDVIEILDYAKRKAVTFENIEIISDFGFENAMYTGIFTGLYNGLVYNILGLIHNSMTLENMKVELNPKFEKPIFNLHFMCILRLKTVHTIIIAISVLKIWKKCKKEGSI